MLMTILIGAAIGIGLTLEAIFANCDVRTKKEAAEHSLTVQALCRRVFELEAEKGRLRIALAAGEMTGDGKTIAKLTMAALATIGGEEKAE